MASMSPEELKELSNEGASADKTQPASVKSPAPAA